MLKKAEDNDKSAIIQHLALDESINSPILSQIERYGFSKGFQDVWMINNGTCEPKAIIMRHFNHMYLYLMSDDADYEEIASFSAFFGADIIWSRLNNLESMEPFLKGYRLEPSKNMILHNPALLVPCGRVEHARVEDSCELAEMIFSEKDFKRFYSSESEIEMGIRRRMEMGQCRYMVIRSGSVISVQAYTTIETENYVTIGGVITRPDSRGRGLASQVVSSLCNLIFNQGKRPNLFYKTEDAGRVYKRLGFCESGDYGMLHKI